MRGHIAHTLATVLLVVSLGAAQRPASSESGKTQNVVSPGKANKAKPYQIGTASWYGDYFQGKATASGEPYNMYDLTAAHPTLPLGSWVRVSNLRSWRSGQRLRQAIPPRPTLQHRRLRNLSWSQHRCATSLLAANPLNSIRCTIPDSI